MTTCLFLPVALISPSRLTGRKATIIYLSIYLVFTYCLLTIHGHVKSCCSLVIGPNLLQNYCDLLSVCNLLKNIYIYVIYCKTCWSRNPQVSLIHAGVCNGSFQSEKYYIRLDNFFVPVHCRENSGCFPWGK